MKKDFNKINTIYKVIFIMITIGFNIWIGFRLKNIKVSLGLFIFSVFISTMIFIQERLYQRHMEDIFIDLSDMLSTIINMKNKEVFSTMEDTIFSKLQHQAIKLANILTEKNKKIENDRDEIKALISDIAHQLKTPLTNMKMYSEFLQDEDLSEEETKEFNEIILVSLDKLCFLVESMIKMSRLESSIINLKLKQDDLNDTVLIAIIDLCKKAQLKNINIKFEQVDKVYLLHDKKWTSEAIFNIIENAIKYSKESSTIHISIEKYEMFTRIDICDEGIGISEDEIPKIFTRFYRGKNVQDEEGIGIGLYLSREIISKQGGYIKVKSNSKGSIFSIFLPN